jgi:hypothetical protein
MFTSPSRKSYRICCYDAARHVVSQDWIEAVSDVEAIAKAEALRYGTQCELWDGNRMVARLESRAA